VGKLHEVLAVEHNLRTQADKTRTELKSSFEKKRHLFTKKVVTFKPLDEGEEPVTEEQSDLQSNVVTELGWIAEILARSYDASYQVAVANTEAKGDIILEDGTRLALAVPATTLLELEKRTSELRDLCQAIPTLDPAKGFTLDPDAGANVYKAREDKRTRTKKVAKVFQLAPATDKHPAQVQAINEDVPVGSILTQEWSGLITPAEKATLIGRIESLHRSVKQARSRANETAVNGAGIIGKTILDYAFFGTTPAGK
jgi:hypothetical protein